MTLTEYRAYRKGWLAALTQARRMLHGRKARTERQLGRRDVVAVLAVRLAEQMPTPSQLKRETKCST